MVTLRFNVYCALVHDISDSTRTVLQPAKLCFHNLKLRLYVENPGEGKLGNGVCFRVQNLRQLKNRSKM